MKLFLVSLVVGVSLYGSLLGLNHYAVFHPMKITHFLISYYGILVLHILPAVVIMKKIFTKIDETS